jgi:hypothetical protein
VPFPKRLALSVPYENISVAEHVPLAREMERLGYTDAWSYEIDGNDAFVPLDVVPSTVVYRREAGGWLPMAVCGRAKL